MNRRRKICIVAPVHTWDDVRVFQKQAVTAASVGYEVVLLAQADGHSLKKGVQIVPVWTPRTPRSVRFLCLPLVLVQALAQRADLYHLHNPDTLPIAIALTTLGRRVVYDTHEDFARRLLMREWIPKHLRRILARGVAALERAVAGLVDATIVTQAEVATRVGLGALVIGNAPRTNDALLEEVDRRAALVADFFDGLRAVYIGGISEARGLLEMVDAMALANERASVRLWLIGPAQASALAKARARPGWQYVDYLERQPQEVALAHVARSDVGLIVLRDVGDHSATDPNKIYEYMTFSVPFIASDFPRWRQRLADADAGWFVPPADARVIAEALAMAANDPALRLARGRNGKQYVRSYNWEKESTKLAGLYARVLAQQERREDLG